METLCRLSYWGVCARRGYTTPGRLEKSAGPFPNSSATHVDFGVPRATDWHGGRPNPPTARPRGGRTNGNVIFDMSGSLDDYVAAVNRTADEPLGAGGERLHAWALASDERNAELLGAAVSRLGAMIAGRTTYDDSIRWWGADGVESAVRQAKAAAGDRDVAVMGGPDIGSQCLAAGLVDEIGIHVVPVLFGAGLPMFPVRDISHVDLEPVQTVETPQATHLRFRVVK
jgi:riboflavin biosynthesis pyrimidine reductase